MHARRLILNDNAYSHVFFRCHNKQFFLRPKILKQFFLLLLAKHKDKYGIKIYEFNILDNHVHLLIQSKSTAKLGDFMRVVNSQLARKINQHFNRDSQAIRERYKSPMVSNSDYLVKLMSYIWLNRYKVNKSALPQKDPYCSLSWRLGNTLVDSLVSSKEDQGLLSSLLDPLEELPIEGANQSKITNRYLLSLIGSALERVHSFVQKVFESYHTVGDTEAVKFRGEYLSAFNRQKRNLVFNS